MKKKISKWQIFKWDMQRNWQNLWIRKIALVIRAYFKLYWAYVFSNDEFSLLLRLDQSALFVMNTQQRHKYELFLIKVRNRVGWHGQQEDKKSEYFEVELFKRIKKLEL